MAKYDRYKFQYLDYLLLGLGPTTYANYDGFGS